MAVIYSPFSYRGNIEPTENTCHICPEEEIKGGDAYDCVYLCLGRGHISTAKLWTAGKGWHAQKRVFKRGINPYSNKTTFSIQKGGFLMKFRPIYNHKFHVSAADREVLSTKDYTCMFILQTMKGQPVAVSMSNDIDTLIWRVQYGFSTVYFADYAEAMDFCREHFCDLGGNRLKKTKEKK